MLKRIVPKNYKLNCCHSSTAWFLRFFTVANLLKSSFYLKFYIPVNTTVSSHVIVMRYLGVACVSAVRADTTSGLQQGQNRSKTGINEQIFQAPLQAVSSKTEKKLLSSKWLSFQKRDLKRINQAAPSTRGSARRPDNRCKAGAGAALCAAFGHIILK